MGREPAHIDSQTPFKVSRHCGLGLGLGLHHAQARPVTHLNVRMHFARRLPLYHTGAPAKNKMEKMKIVASHLGSLGSVDRRIAYTYNDIYLWM